ncbi:MAG: hypothetical protein GWP04_00525 [Gammaproteobacteria bacterium]|nr:hypothetical protein [Gammaproteobacteria bacterium]
MNKVLVVGLDGATLDLIEPWAAEGLLPNFARLLAESHGGVLPSTIPPMTPPAWVTFATGVTPGSHGIFDWTYRRSGSYETTPFSARDIAVPTIWEHLATRGRSALVINVPMTYPPKPIDGVMIAGMPAPKWDASAVSPADRFAEIAQRVPSYVLYPDPGEAYSSQGTEGFITRLHLAAEGRMQTWRLLREEREYDFEMVAFNGTDTAQHALWHLMDETHPAHDPSAPERHRGAICDYYQRIDGYLGEFMDTAEREDRMLLVMSDHGGGPLKGLIHVNNWLLGEGLLRLKSNLTSRIRYRLYRLGFTPMALYGVLIRLGLGKLKREVVRGHGRSLLTTFFLSFRDVDWTKTSAYSIGNVGQVFLNVEGREPQGTVSPDDYDSVRRDIRQRLEAWMRDGEPVVEQVVFSDEIWSGEHVDDGPDILFLPKGLEFFGFGEFEFGSNRVFEDLKQGISGTHRMPGIGIWWGPGTTEPTAEARAVDQHLEDLAPTIIHAMGEDIPASTQGRVLQEILIEDRDVVRAARDSAPVNGDEPTFTEEEEAAIEERLRGLGYV